jgi:hypothetical protein
MPKSYKWLIAAIVFITFACQGSARGCQATCAENYGADWVVVQTDWEGYPYRCWTLKNTAIANEKNSDGIYWVDPKSKNLVHISGGYNRVQVIDNRWDEAFATLGITKEICEEVQKKIHHQRPEELEDEEVTSDPAP